MSWSVMVLVLRCRVGAVVDAAGVAQIGDQGARVVEIDGVVDVAPLASGAQQTRVGHLLEVEGKGLRGDVEPPRKLAGTLAARAVAHQLAEQREACLVGESRKASDHGD